MRLKVKVLKLNKMQTWNRNFDDAKYSFKTILDF